MKNKFRLLLFLLVLVVFLGYFFLNTDKFRPLLDINYGLLFLIAAGNVVGIFLNGLFTKFILRPFNKDIPLIESFYVSLISSVGNFFAPVGAGFGFRAVYLKRKFGLPYSEYISTLSGNYILVFLVDSFMGLVAMYLLRSRSSSSAYGLLVVIFAIIFMVSAALSIFKVPIKSMDGAKNQYLHRALKIIYQILHGWNHIVSHKRLMVQLVGLSFASLALTAAMTWMIIHSIHLTVGFAPLMLFGVLNSLSLFINLTPANLGVKEAIYLFSSHVLGFSLNQIVLIALIDRGVLFLVLLILWASSSNMREREKVKAEA